jgi:hypothetical protein
MQTLDKSEIIEYSVEHGMKRKYLSKVVDILVEYANKRQTITYSELGKKLAGDGATFVGQQLHPLRDYLYDKNYPVLTSIVVSKSSYTPSYTDDSDDSRGFVDGKKFDFSKITDEYYRKRIINGFQAEVFLQIWGVK